MVLGKNETFEKANLGWLYEVTADPDRSLLEPTISVRGDVLAVLFKIRSKDGGETEAPLLFFDLVGPKGEGRYAFREPLPEELQIERAYKVFDFWDAVGRTPLLGYVAVAQEGAGIERSLLKVLPEGTPMRPFSVLDEQAWRAMVPGRYVVPLIALKEGYEPFGGVYRSPAVPEEELGAFAALVERWRACKTQEEKVAFLHGIISMPSMGRLASDTLRRLNGIAAFDADLTADELQLWGNVVANEKLDIARRADVLKALLEENRSQIREYVTYALAEPKLRKLIVEDLRASAPKLLRAILIDWLGDPKVRLEALGLGWEYRNDKEFIAAAEESLADAADSEVQAFVPFLLSRNSKRGKAMLIDLIGGDRAPAAKASVFSGLMSANDPEIVAAVRKSVASLWAERKARGAREAVARGMAYLCACRDPAGIEYTKGLLPEFDRDEEMQKHLSNAMMTVSHLPFRNWAACRQWIEALAVEN